MGAAQRTLEIIWGYLGRRAVERRTLGIFCPARFINYHALLGTALELRYFDDDPLLTGRYFPPINVAIESREDLIRRPVDELLIMSWTFGDVIAEGLRHRSELDDTKVVLIGELVGRAARAP